jgi:hypothetical protein
VRIVSLAATLIAIALAMPVVPTAATVPGHSKKQAELNVLKVPFVAASVSNKTHAICAGVGHHVGIRYRTFTCRVSPFEGGLLLVRYTATAGGHFRVVLA